MDRLTTDNPSTMLEACLNLFFAKDCEAMVRAGAGYEDKKLLDWIREAMDVTDVHIMPYPTQKGNDEILMEALDAWLDEGPETREGVIAYCYLAMWVAAELRARLKKYEDAEEEGRLCMTPCKVGDLVYALWSVPTNYKYVIYCAEVKEIRIAMRNCRLTTTYFLEPIEYRGHRKEYRDDDFGNLVFPTQEEAEAALAERKMNDA